MNPALIDDDTLLAYLDAQFDDEARYVAVEDALAAQPALRARLQALVDSVARPPRVRRATRPHAGIAAAAAGVQKPARRCQGIARAAPSGRVTLLSHRIGAMDGTL